jgi:hypothetical protein
MNAMSQQPGLSEAEWALVVELLQREYHDLPAEIHHTRVASFREELRRREAMIKSLLERLHATTSQTPP